MMRAGLQRQPWYPTVPGRQIHPLALRRRYLYVPLRSPSKIQPCFCVALGFVAWRPPEPKRKPRRLRRGGPLPIHSLHIFRRRNQYCPKGCVNSSNRCRVYRAARFKLQRLLHKSRLRAWLAEIKGYNNPPRQVRGGLLRSWRVLTLLWGGRREVQ